MAIGVIFSSALYFRDKFIKFWGQRFILSWTEKKLVISLCYMMELLIINGNLDNLTHL